MKLFSHLKFVVNWHFKFQFWAIIVGSLAACQTSKPDSAVKVKGGDLYVLVGHDERSATPKPYSKSKIKELQAKVQKSSKDPNQSLTAQVALAELALMDGDLAKARESAKRALAIDFRDNQAKLVVAQVAFAEQRYAESKAILDQLGGEKSGDSEVLTLLGSIAWADGDSRRAETIFGAAIAKNADDVAARMNLGILFLQRENDKGAEKQFLEILARIPTNVDARIHLGIAYARQGRLEEAEDSYYEAKSSGAGKNPLLLYDLAVVQRRAGKFDAALKTTKALLDLRGLSVGEQEQVLALLDDIRMEQNVAGESDTSEIDELMADTQEKIKNANGMPVSGGDSEGRDEGTPAH